MALKLNPTPLPSLQVSRYYIPAHNLIPNTSIQNKQLLHYHEVFPPSTLTASAIESHLTEVGVVEPQWRYTMYSTTHFHSTTHEVLCISQGKAKLCFGGEDNPGKVEKEVVRGDVLILPAGVGHRLLQDFTGRFEMVGSYPKGYNWDMCYGKTDEEAKVKNIGTLPWFERDPSMVTQAPCSKFNDRGTMRYMTAEVQFVFVLEV
ncbi:RmlC-like cupin domain-containing protein [Annulohypoxylon maeteangense]|uniref:RmlC-like cupin domain-containing protein n=1 Tax=Annulohypoxylon maeteangense TaxID=1927788 RepID=UPI002008176A|nr:RmlC-like cupin domain-containing protein [Annulohypoxylon maeteangense]KAI0886293.1 RmlC-like cupin domain-containing protein [Annulohypoxylon maeteangense]